MLKLYTQKNAQTRRAEFREILHNKCTHVISIQKPPSTPALLPPHCPLPVTTPSRVTKIQDYNTKGQYRVSQPQLDNSLLGVRWGNCPVHCRMFSRISGLYPPDARSTLSPSCDNQKCLQKLPNIWEGGKQDHPQLRITGLEDNISPLLFV